MSKTSKRAILILIIATFMMSMIPFMPAQAVITTVNLSAGPYVYDTTYVVTGNPADGVTSGATVEIYWDTAIGEGAQLLNSTTAEADGMWEVWFDLPEAIQGDHYIWAKDTSGPFYASSGAFTVDPLVELSTSSGLPGDDVDVEGHGFGDEAVVGIIIEPWTVTGEAVGLGTGSQTIYYVDYFPVVAASETIYVNAVPHVDTVDYTFVDATGQITFITIPAAAAVITADYTRDAYTIEASSTYESDELGAFTKTFDVPNFPYGPYTITATDDETVPNTASATFTLGASITVTPDEGNTGTRITVDGRGWTPTETITFTYDGNPAEVVDAAIVTVGSTGKFSADVIIPSMPGITLGKADLTAAESGAVKGPASDKFEVLGLPEIEVSPTYGSPGSTITVTGYNWTQKADTEVVLTLWGKAPDPVVKVADLVIVETESDGTFEDTFMSPAVGFTGYDVRAEDAEYHLYADDAFKVGLIAMIINPTYGAAGTEVSLTGIGFEPGDYNLTFGDKLYEDYGTGVSGGEAISDVFYAPNVEPGTYDVSVIDEQENELTTQFTVTAVTEVTLDPAMAPNDYNMTIEGENFADKVGALDFVLFNSTDDWSIDVYENGAGTVAAATDITGNFTGWWIVLPEGDLSLGDYTMNITGVEDFLIQLNFTVVEPRVDVAPRKALFDRGDTIQFNVNNDFDFPDSYMKIYDPYDNLYWQTELFADWVKAAGLYTVPYYLQTSGMNPMTLSQDAPMGTWLWIFYETGTTQLVNGTFEVGPSSAAQVDEKLSEIWGSIEGLTEDIDDITSEIGDDIAALSGEIDDVVADVQDMVNDITSDLAGELAQVAQDTEAAVADLEDSIGDIASAQNDLASELDAVSQDTTAAREAAEDAQTAAQGLTTLVYGAIGASLIAALAAIVSLMQISKKIA